MSFLGCSSRHNDGRFWTNKIRFQIHYRKGCHHCVAHRIQYEKYTVLETVCSRRSALLGHFLKAQHYFREYDFSNRTRMAHQENLKSENGANLCSQMNDTGINMGGLFSKIGASPCSQPCIQEEATETNNCLEVPFQPRAIPTVQTLYSAKWKNVRLEGISRVTAFNSVRTVTKTGHCLGLRNP